MNDTFDGHEKATDNECNSDASPSHQRKIEKNPSKNSSDYPQKVSAAGKETGKDASDQPVNLFQEVRHQVGQQSGIDPELMPYIEEANRSDSDQHLSSTGDEDIDYAIAQLVKTSMLSGPLDEVYAEIAAGGEAEEGDSEGDSHTASQRGDGALWHTVGAPATQEAKTEENGCGWVDGHTASQWVDGHTASQWGDGHTASREGGAGGREPESELESLARAQTDRQDFLRVYNQIAQRRAEHRPNPSLDRIEQVMDYMADPQHTYRSIHVTGTNGKTSVTRMIDALLVEQGIRTGRFTSPHLHSATERICFDGQPLSHRAFVDAYNDVSAIVDLVDQHFAERGEGPLSFFEILTAMAYQAFADKPIDTAVVEVGMGGRWDCTNVIPSEVQVITPIAVDHQRWLGATREDIARVKAGIIKPGSIVICGPQRDSVRAIIDDEAARQHAIVRHFGNDIQLVDRQLGVGGQMLTIRTPACEYTDIFVPLLGRHQAVNAALALAAVEAFMGGAALKETIVENGFQAVSSPGRLEVVRTSPTVLVDSCHNPHGADALVDAIEESFNFTTTVGIYSAMADKDIESVLSILEPCFDELMLVQMPGERGASIDDMTAIASEVFGAERVHPITDQPNYYDAIAQAITEAAAFAEADDSAGSYGGIVACGSVVFAADVRHVCGKA